MLLEAATVNTRRHLRVIDLAREELGTHLRGKRVTVWGRRIQARDRRHPRLARPRRDRHRHHPKALNNARKFHPEYDYVEDPITAVDDADLLLHLTEWPQFSHIDPKWLATRTHSPDVIDACGTVNTDQWRDAGWIVRALRRP
ncbi:UDP binding domain-containing protein [Streptomyces sp. NPDC059134]|uniref:UDP binding domain-containing protein n=1 Tax=Streptomyces sp. NPDC059134 TaxID=3346738 RepID=UPI00367C99BE